MYDYIQEAIDNNKVVLEKGVNENDSIPLLKDIYAVERKHAKIINFSIAYGMNIYLYICIFIYYIYIYIN